MRKYKSSVSQANEICIDLCPNSLGFRFTLRLGGGFCFCPFCRCCLILVLGAGNIVYVGIRDDIYQLQPIVKLVLHNCNWLFCFRDDLVVRNLYGFLTFMSFLLASIIFSHFIIFMINAFNYVMALTA